MERYNPVVHDMHFVDTADHIHWVHPHDLYVKVFAVNPSVNEDRVVIGGHQMGVVSEDAFFLVPVCTNLKTNNYKNMKMKIHENVFSESPRIPW